MSTDGVRPAPPAATLSFAELVEVIKEAQAAGRLDDAERLCKIAIDQQPDNASLHIWLGWIAIDRKVFKEALAAARQAASLPGHDTADVARLMVYAAAMSGDWMVASETFRDLARSDDGAARALAVETAPAFLAYLNDLRRNEAFQDATNSFECVPDILRTAAPEVMRDISETASICYLVTGKAKTAIAIFGRAVAGTPGDGQQPSRSRPLLITSLMPSRLDTQKAAVASWQREGFDVASLNASDEIAPLQRAFDGVTFHAADRDARGSLGRPLVYVDDMLDILAGEPERVGGIINSDIVFASDAGQVLPEAVSLAEEAFLFGHRLDVQRLDDTDCPESRLLLFGYDWFLFGGDQAVRLAGGGMVFGAPWWDLWMPLRARSLGHNLINVRHPVALHEQHPQRWNQADLATMARVLVTGLLTDACRSTSIMRVQRRLAELGHLLRGLPPEALADPKNLDWFASLLRGLIQAEAAPFGHGGPTAHRFWDPRGQV